MKQAQALNCLRNKTFLLKVVCLGCFLTRERWSSQMPSSPAGKQCGAGSTRDYNASSKHLKHEGGSLHFIWKLVKWAPHPWLTTLRVIHLQGQHSGAADALSRQFLPFKIVLLATRGSAADLEKFWPGTDGPLCWYRVNSLPSMVLPNRTKLPSRSGHTFPLVKGTPWQFPVLGSCLTVIDE